MQKKERKKMIRGRKSDRESEVRGRTREMDGRGRMRRVRQKDKGGKMWDK